jgi:hypothetical protein
MTPVSTVVPYSMPPLQAAPATRDRTVEPVDGGGAVRDRPISLYDPPRAILRLLDSTRESFQQLEQQRAAITSEPADAAAPELGESAGAAALEPGSGGATGGRGNLPSVDVFG